MTGQQLRNSILQEAIHGRLVPNTLQPGELTAPQLLNEILATRQKAENEAKGKKARANESNQACLDCRVQPRLGKAKAKKLTLSEIEEEPWELPEGWCWCKHNDLFEVSGGSQPPKSYFKEFPIEGHVRLYQIRDYGPNPVPTYVPTSMVSKFTQKGDILIARYGGSLGKIFWAEEGAYNVAMAKSIPLYKGLVLPKFLYYFYHSELFHEVIFGASGRSAQSGFNKEDLEKLYFPLPPLSIQHSIVSKIESLLPLVEAYDAAQGELKELNAGMPDKLRKSVLQEAIHGRLVPNTLQPGELTAPQLLNEILATRQKAENEAKGKKAKKLSLSKIEEEPWELPEGWCWCRLGDVAEIERGGNFVKSDFVEKGYPCIHYGQIHMKLGARTTQALTFLTEEKAARQRKAHYGDIVMAVTSENIEDVCKCTAWLGKEDVAIGAHTAIFRHYIDSMYFVYYTQSAIFVNQKKEIGHGSKVIEVTPVKMNDFLLPLPPLSIQHSIVAKIEEIFAILDSL